MMPTIPSNYANAIAPFSPLGRRAVGEEDADLKSRASTLKALEESAETARGENRRSPDERAGEAGEQVRLSRHSQQLLDDQKVLPVERRGREQSQQEQEQLVRALAAQGAELEAGARAELLRLQAQKLLASLHALRAMSPETEMAAAGAENEDTAAREQTAQAHAAQREMLQRQVDLSRRLIDMGIDTDPAPAGHRLSQRI